MQSTLNTLSSIANQTARFPLAMCLYKISDTFLSEVLQIWSVISFNGNITSNKQFWSMNLWHNSLIKVGNSPIYYKTWATKLVCEVRHLVKVFFP